MQGGGEDAVAGECSAHVHVKRGETHFFFPKGFFKTIIFFFLFIIFLSEQALRHTTLSALLLLSQSFKAS